MVVIEPVRRPARKGVRPSIPAGPVRVMKRLSLGMDIRLVSSRGFPRLLLSLAGEAGR